MNLHAEVIKGLSTLCNETIISEEVLKHILLECVNTLCGSNKQSTSLQSYTTNKSDVVKLVQYSLTSLFTEQLKVDGEQDIATTLKKLKIPEVRIKIITKAYVNAKTNILKNILNFDDNDVPHISGVRWKLDYVLKNNEVLEKDLLYRIEFTNNDDPIHFNCSIDQLQDLLFKLKDIQNHCNKIASLTN